jgi:hypothetical protein
MHSRRSKSWPTSPIRISPNIAEYRRISRFVQFVVDPLVLFCSGIASPHLVRCHHPQQPVAYRIANAADASPLPRHLAHWSPEGKAALRRWSVLTDEGPKDWMSTALRAHDLVQSVLGDVPWVLEKTGRKA